MSWLDAVAYGPSERAKGMRVPPMTATRRTAGAGAERLEKLPPELLAGVAPERLAELPPELSAGLAPELFPELMPELSLGLVPELSLGLISTHSSRPPRITSGNLTPESVPERTGSRTWPTAI